MYSIGNLRKLMYAHNVSGQDFLWYGEYSDGSMIAEYDLNTNKRVSFYDIEKDSLIRFGMVGHGMHLYYEVFGGVFKLNGQPVEVIYKISSEEYNLTGNPTMYNDIITYKNAESTAVFKRKEPGRIINRVTQYNFGYKANLLVKGVNFHFKAICSIPYNRPVYMHFRLTADKDLDGKLIIRKNGLVIDEFNAPLKKDVGGELNWIVR